MWKNYATTQGVMEKRCAQPYRALIRAGRSDIVSRQDGYVQALLVLDSVEKVGNSGKAQIVTP